MERKVRDLADLFASAALGDVSWLHALQQLGEATGAARGQLIGIGADAIQFNWVNHFTPGELTTFHSHDIGSADSNYRVAAASGDPILTIRSEQDYAGVPRTAANEAYRDLVRTYDLPHGCQTILYSGDQEMIGLAVLKTEAEGESRACERGLFATVAPHVRSAVRTQMALENGGAALVSGALDTMTAAVFMCSSRGRVRQMTGSAEELVRTGRMHIVGGILEAPHRPDTSALHARIAEHAGPDALPMESIVIGRRGMGQLPMLADICRSIPRARSVTPTVMVVVRSARQWHGRAPVILRELYDLSQAEAEVMLSLAAGMTRSMISEARGVSLETIRSQVKAAFAKLGVNREVEAAVMLGDFLRV